MTRVENIVDGLRPFGQISVYVYEKIIWYDGVVYYSSVWPVHQLARNLKEIAYVNDN